MAITGIKREQNRYAAFLLTPALLVIILFTSIPALTTLSYAFFRWKGFQRQGFAGFENFERLFNDPFKSYFYMALRHNVLVFIAILIIQTSLGILVGYALFKLKRGHRYFRTVVFLPVIFSLVIVAYMWQAMLDPFYGPINFLLKEINLEGFAKTFALVSSAKTDGICSARKSALEVDTGTTIKAAARKNARNLGRIKEIQR